MIAWLNGKIIEKLDQAVTLNVHGVGYEVFGSARTIDSVGDVGTEVTFHIYTNYKSDGSASLFGFLSRHEKELFLSLIKVDSVGPKSALNILSAAPWMEIAELIEAGDTETLAGLPKISKKTAEHLVVKLKGKLTDLLVGATTRPQSRLAANQQLRNQAHTALVHLGYRAQDANRALDDIEDWSLDLQTIIRHALNDLSGNN